MPSTIKTLALIACLLLPTALTARPTDAPAIADAATLIRKQAAGHRLILIGELHGTRQVPELVARLVTAYASSEPVLLGLEVHASEQPAIDRYLRSDGDAKARAALARGAFWRTRGVQHDGRRNYDVLDLIEKVRRLEAAGREVGVLAFDNPAGDAVESQARDKAMADRLRRAFAAMPRGRLLAVAGNVHAMLERPAYAPAQMQTPMGSWLRDLHPFSIDIGAREGDFWACMKTCGSVAVQPRADASGPTDGGDYNLLIVLPRLTVAHLIGAPPVPERWQPHRLATEQRP